MRKNRTHGPYKFLRAWKTDPAPQARERQKIWVKTLTRNERD